jgi:hypothetical protein
MNPLQKKETNRTSFLCEIRKDITTRNIKGQQKTKKMSNEQILTIRTKIMNVGMST